MSEKEITHKGVTYYPIENLPPLKTHVATCPRCDGTGQMYGRDCKDCEGRGLLYPPLSQAEEAGTTGNGGD